MPRERARALQAAVGGHAFKIENLGFALGVRIGIAVIRHDRRDVHAVIAAAETACCAAKRRVGAAPRIEETILD